MAIKRVAERLMPYFGVLVAALALLLFLSVLRGSLFLSVPEEKHIWFDLSSLLLLAILAEMLVVRTGQPSVMLMLVVGVMASQSAIGLVYPALAGIASYAGIFLPEAVPRFISTEGLVRTFAQLGAIMLLFKIGLHSEVKSIFNLRNFVVAILGIVVPFAGGYYFAVLTGHGFSYAMFLGAALTATSVGVTVAVLEEFKLMKREFAKVILGAAVIDDILALLVLSVVTNFPTSVTVSSIMPFVLTLLSAAVFVMGGISIGIHVVRKYFDKAIEDDISRAEFLGILAYVLIYAYVAEFIGLSAIVGAFIAGVTLNYSRLTPKLFALFYPLEAFFTPVFFISLGMFIDIPALWHNFSPIVAITLIAIFTKLVGCGLGAKIMGASTKDSLLVGLGMIPRGEIALIIGLFGLTAVGATGEPVLREAEYSIIASMAFLTTVIIPVVLQKAVGLAKVERTG